MTTVVTLPARCPPWPKPLAAATDIGRVDRLITEANQAIDRLLAVTTQVRERLVAEALALPPQFDLDAVAEDWYRRSIEPLRVKGVFDADWMSVCLDYAEAARHTATLFSEWAMIADRLDALSERLDDTERMLDQLVDGVLEDESRRRMKGSN